MLTRARPNARRHSIRRPLFLAPPLVALCALVPAYGIAGGAHAAEAQAVTENAEAGIVKIGNFTFSPATLTVTPGTTVTWTNEDDIPHTVAAKNKAFRSKTLDTDDKFTFTFAAPGEYDYFCSLHPHMVGRIVVKAAGAGGASQ
jgi:plastocyanin